MIKSHWGPPASKCEIQDYQNKDKLLILYSENLTGPHKTFDWAACGPRLDIAGLGSWWKAGIAFYSAICRYCATVTALQSSINTHVRKTSWQACLLAWNGVCFAVITSLRSITVKALFLVYVMIIWFGIFVKFDTFVVLSLILKCWINVK